MIAIFVTLRLRLLRNVFKTDGALAFVLFSILALLFSSMVTIGLVGADRVQPGLLPLMGALLLIAWSFGPLLFGGSDETIDTTRLALFPVPARQLAPGMALANLIGPGPIAVGLPLFAMAFKTGGPLQILVGLTAAFSTVLLASVLSRWVQTVIGNLLRKRNRRDMVMLFAGLFAGGIGILSQVILFTGFSTERITQGGRVARWLPGGWTGWALEAMQRNGDGSTLIVAMGATALTLLLAAAVAWFWIAALERALSEVTEGGVDSIGRTHFMDSTGVAGMVLHRLGPYAPVLAKEIRYLRRHPRYRVQVVSQFIVLIIGGAPFLLAILDRNPTSVLFGCIPALTAGITSSNLLGADGRALWGEVLAIDTMKTILRGRAIAFFLLGVGASTIVILGTSIWTGGWRFAPAALAASIGMGFAGSGTGAFTSTLAPVLLPDETNPNPFASGDMGQGCVSGIFTFGGAFVGLLTAGPILLGLAYARTELWAQILMVVAAPIYGFIFFVVTTERAGRRADQKTPDLVAALT